VHFNVTAHPTAEWVCQQLREAFPNDGRLKYAILDRDSKFSTFCHRRGADKHTEPLHTQDPLATVPLASSLNLRLLSGIRVDQCIATG